MNLLILDWWFQCFQYNNSVYVSSINLLDAETVHGFEGEISQQIDKKRSL